MASFSKVLFKINHSTIFISFSGKCPKFLCFQEICHAQAVSQCSGQNGISGNFSINLKYNFKLSNIFHIREFQSIKDFFINWPIYFFDIMNNLIGIGRITKSKLHLICDGDLSIHFFHPFR